ncbi:DUF6735 family protein [Halarchaeum sp. P4]
MRDVARNQSGHRALVAYERLDGQYNHHDSHRGTKTPS